MKNQDLDIKDSRSAAERLSNPQKIKTEELIDKNNEARNLYTLPSGDQVIFRGRDDFYIPPIDTARTPTLLTYDEKPHKVTDQKPPSNPAEVTREGESLYVTNATPIGVIDLAITIKGGSEIPDNLLRLRENIAKREFGKKENALLDLMAASIYDPNSYNSTSAPDLEGLIKVALALNGDKDALEDLNVKLAEIETSEDKLSTAQIGDAVLEKVLVEESSVTPEILEDARGIMLVRATDFQPEISPDGTVIVQSASDYTHNIEFNGDGFAFIPRETIHFSINHRVESHMSGNFESKKFIIVSPLDRALESNGAPARMADVDTYFLTGPNEKIILPDSTIVSPEENMDEIIKRNGNRIYFKSSGYQESDLDKVEMIQPEASLKNKLMQLAEQYSMFTDERNDFIIQFSVENGNMPKWRLAPPLDRERCKGMGFKELAVHIAARGGEDDNPIGLDFLMNDIVSSIVVEETITEKGGKVVGGGMHYTSSEELGNRVSSLADKLQTHRGLHSSTAEQAMEAVALRQIYSDELDYVSVNKQLSDARLPHNIRRSYIANGLLIARGKRPLVSDPYSGI